MRRKKQNNNDRPHQAMPPTAFLEWWNPTGTDEPSGASIGGHPDAERVWARKDPGRWTRRTYGINAVLAWTCQCYRDEYERWIDAEQPEREPFVSIAATLEQQYELMKKLKAILKGAAKPMPKEDNDAIDFHTR